MVKNVNPLCTDTKYNTLDCTLLGLPNKNHSNLHLVPFNKFTCSSLN